MSIAVFRLETIDILLPQYILNYIHHSPVTFTPQTILLLKFFDTVTEAFGQYHL